MENKIQTYWINGHLSQSLHTKPNCGRGKRNRLKPERVELTRDEAIKRYRFCRICNKP
jgi:hypothetical protein